MSTRVAKVLTNETCDLRCAFCNARRSHERRNVAGANALRKRLHEHCAAQPEQLILSGGEPTLRKDLPAIIRAARTGTEAELVLETHGLHITPQRLERWVQAGLDVVRVHLPAWEESLDVFTGQVGAGERMQEVLRTIERSALTLETATPFVAANLAHASALPTTLSNLGLTPRTMWFGVPTTAPDPVDVAAPHAAAHAAAKFVRAARRASIACSLDPAAFVPPCTFDNPAAIAHVYALNPGAASRSGFVHAPACESCSVRARCPGPPEGHPTIAKTLHSDRLQRRLTVIGTPREQIARELVTHEVYRGPDGRTTPAATVRINFRCNQSCRFCFVSTHLPDPDDDAVAQAIDAIADKRGTLALSGGEPTLNPKLPQWITRAKAAGVAEVELQTNATRMHLDDLASRLDRAGLDRAFVSLHGATAKTSDAITEAPGTYEETLLGIDAIARTNVALRLNYVLCTLNYREFPQFVDQLATRWPAATLNVSFVGPSTDLVPRTRALIPRYEDVMPFVAEGMNVARAVGLDLGGFESMCGVPLCLVPGDVREYLALAAAQPGLSEEEFLKPSACARCVLEPRCFGLRRGYAELYGTAALRPVVDRIPQESP